MDIEALVKQIEAEMERQLLTQSEVARMAGIGRERIYKVLHRRSRSIPTIRAMRAALGLADKDHRATR